MATYDQELRECIDKQMDKPVSFVTPDWVTDCVGAGSLLDELKYDPKYLQTSNENHLILMRMQQTCDEGDNEGNRMLKTIVEDGNSKSKPHHHTPVITIKTDNFFNQNIHDNFDGRSCSSFSSKPFTPRSSERPKKSEANGPNAF